MTPLDRLADVEAQPSVPRDRRACHLTDEIIAAFIAAARVADAARAPNRRCRCRNCVAFAALDNTLDAAIVKALGES